MKKTLTILTLIGLLSSLFGGEKQKLLINITSTDQYKVPMAVSFANKSLQFGFETAILLNVD